MVSHEVVQNVGQGCVQLKAQLRLGGSASNMADTHGSYGQEAPVSHHMDLAIGSFGCPINMAAAFLQSE